MADLIVCSLPPLGHSNLPRGETLLRCTERDLGTAGTGTGGVGAGGRLARKTHAAEVKKETARHRDIETLRHGGSARCACVRWKERVREKDRGRAEGHAQGNTEARRAPAAHFMFRFSHAPLVTCALVAQRIHSFPRGTIHEEKKITRDFAFETQRGEVKQSRPAVPDHVHGEAQPALQPNHSQKERRLTPPPPGRGGVVRWVATAHANPRGHGTEMPWVSLLPALVALNPPISQKTTRALGLQVCP